MTATMDRVVAPFPLWSKNESALLIYHGGDLGKMNNSMPTYKANAICYHHPNSLSGLYMVKKYGANSLDNDIQITKDGVIVVTHWEQPLLSWVGFYDITGKHKVGSTIRIDQMTYHDVSNLRSRVGGYRIRSLAEHMRTAAVLGITPCFEQKGDKRFQEKAIWDQAMRSVIRAGGHAKMMTLPNHTGLLAVHAAGQAGWECGVLSRGVVPKEYFTIGKIAWFKGSLVNGKHAPSNVVRLGTSSAYATRYGCSVGDGTVTARRIVKAKGGHVTFYKKAA